MKAHLQRLSLLLLLFGSFYTTEAADYYWVGGSGNWSDLSHWATTSGGGTGHVQVPTSDDDVFFDAGSFNSAADIITLNSDNIFFRDMTWNQAIAGVTLIGGSEVTMSVYGAFILSPGINYEFDGDIIFNSEQLEYKDITAHGFKLAKNVLFDSRQGQWTFTHNVSVDSIFKIQDGIISVEPDIEITTQFLRCKADEEASLILEGSIIVTGNDFLENFYIDRRAIEIDASLFLIAPGANSTITLTGDNATLYAEGSSNNFLGMRNVDFSNPNGTSTINVDGGLNLSVWRIRFSSNGQFIGLISTVELVLTESKTYIWESGVTYEIEMLTAVGSCSSPINLIASIPGQEASFFEGSSTSGEYLNIKDISISSGGAREVNNSLDLGNTAGWVINERTSQDLFWVGGTGNWDDATHWATTSGGVGGLCIPSANDNVFFDNNSFTGPGQSVSLNIDDAYCKDFNWNTGGQVNDLFSDQKNLHIGGSLLVASMMNWQLGGNIYFESDDAVNPQMIMTSGVELDKEIWITGSGLFQLADDLYLEEVINHEFGTFDTNGFNLNTRGYLALNTNEKTLLLSSSIWTMRFGENFGSEFRINGENSTVDAGSSTLLFTEPGSFAAVGENKLTFNRVIYRTDGSISEYGSDGGIGNQRIKFLQVANRSGLYGSLQIDTLDILPGTVFTLRENETNQVDYLRAIGTCDAPISLRNLQPGSPGIIETNRINTDIQNVFVQDWHTEGTGSFTGTSSVDLGNNTGWTLMNDAGRSLYWVGDNGNWEDRAHWSLTSGGPGGECIPTPLDSVFFDENSFSLEGQTVTAQFAYFKNLDCSNSDRLFRFGINQSFSFGSIILSDLSEVNYWNTIILQGDNPSSILDLRNARIGIIIMSAGDGDWTILGGVDIVNELDLASGKIDFGNSQITTSRVQLSNGENLEIDFSNSVIDVTGESGFVYPIESYLRVAPIVNPSNGIILLSSVNTGIDFNGIGIPLNSVRFTNPDGFAEIRNDANEGNMFVANHVQFDGDGLMNLESSIDSLILAPGKSYQLKSGVAQTINKHLQILGNNCSSIELTSTQVGNLADININNFEVIGDFIQMRDIRINNIESSFAGIHSTDIGNSNIGWIFDDAPNSSSEEQGFFGDDQVLCNGGAIVLEAYPFNANATFEWQDGSINNSLDVDMPGEYWARVTFDGSCSIIDTIQILPQDEFAVVLGNDTTLCDAASLILDVSVSGATYRWQDGTEEASFNVIEAGEYSVDVNLGGCTIQDTIEVGYVSFASIDLGADQTICEDDDISFDVSVPGGTYRWQDNSNLPTFTTDEAGQYYVDVTTDNCTATDTIVISITALANVDLGSDTIICDGLSLELSTEILADSYLWSDGNTTLSTSFPAGKHYLDLTLAGCTATDTIVIDYKPYPVVELGADTTLCTGESLAYDITGSGDSYIWSDGSNLSTFSINAEGQYDVIVGLDGCIQYDTVDVAYAVFPIVDFGMDTILCQGDILTLSVNDPVATAYDWQDGSTSDLIEVNVSGKYYVDAFNSRCKSTDTINIQFNPRPIFDLAEDMIQCLGEPLEVDANVPGASYLWSDGSDLANNSFNAEGNYWVDVTLDGCTIRDSVLLRYIQIPDASLGRDTILCEGEFLFYDFSNLNLQFEWSDTSIDPTNTLGQTGTYWLEVTDRDCASRDSITLLYKPSPTVDLGRDTMLCTGDRINLTQGTFIDETITWSDGSMGNVLAVENSGAYSVEINKNGCIKNDEIIITFNDPPSFDFGQDTLICEQQPLVLQPGISGATYRWQDGSGETTFIVDRPGFYEVEVTKNGCTAIDNIDVETRTCTFYRAYLPEIFSPNNDGLNDTYQPGFPDGLEIISYNMTVYDRWGSQIFVSEDPLVGWDGTYNQAVLNRGTYIYAIAVEYIDDRGPGSKLQRGEVLLIR